jgi:hypothetical protein
MYHKSTQELGRGGQMAHSLREQLRWYFKKTKLQSLVVHVVSFIHERVALKLLMKLRNPSTLIIGWRHTSTRVLGTSRDRVLIVHVIRALTDAMMILVRLYESTQGKRGSP